MNKIFNWTFGSIFRTIGRIIAYLIIGFILFSFINFDKIKDDIKKGVSLDSWVSLPRVYADTFTSVIVDYYQDANLTQRFPNIANQNVSLDFYGFSNQDLYGLQRKFMYYFPSTSTTPYNYAQTDYVRFYYYYNNGSLISTADGPQFEVNAILYFPGNPDIVNWCTQHTIDTNSVFGYIECPTKDISNVTTFNRLEIFLTFKNNEANRFDFGLSNRISFVILDNMSGVDSTLNSINNNISTQTQQIINSQNQTTQDIINNQNTQDAYTRNEIQQNRQAINDGFNNLNSTLTDDSLPTNMTGLDNSYLTGLLPPGPLDSVVNIPLSIMNTIVNTLSGTCSPIVIELPFIHENLTIPCISNIFSNITGLIDFYNGVGVIASAFILYKYLCYLYYWFDDVSSMKNVKPRLFGVSSNADYWGGD